MSTVCQQLPQTHNYANLPSFLFSNTLHKAVKVWQQDGLISPTYTCPEHIFTPARDTTRGDLASHLPMALAQQSSSSPLFWAEKIKQLIQNHPHIESCHIAGPGFVNLRLKTSYWQHLINFMHAEGTTFGYSHRYQGQRVLVESPSTNPTGPLHIGHARIAVVGDCIARLLKSVGYDVTCEYYINDAGAQIDVLARSVIHEAQRLGGINPPKLQYDKSYSGAYITKIAQNLLETHGILGISSHQAFDYCKVNALEANLASIRNTLDTLQIHEDIYTSEAQVIRSGLIDQTLDFLQKADLIYKGTLSTPEGKSWITSSSELLLLFRSSRFGDTLDRPLTKGNGEWTYFAADLAYHLHKIQRGFDLMVNIWGADHGGYVPRLQAGFKALAEPHQRLDIIICQMVTLLENGLPFKMSKRSGHFVTIDDVIDTIGSDSLRFIMAERSTSTHFEYDIQKVQDQSLSNPLFYIQYAHARCCSVQRVAKEVLGEESLAAPRNTDDLALIENETELSLIRTLADWPRQIHDAARSYEIQRIPTFLHTVAERLHALWHAGKQTPHLRFLDNNHPQRSLARLTLLSVGRNVLASGLNLMGITPLQEMH